MKNDKFPPKADQPRAEKFKNISTFLSVILVFSFLFLNFSFAQSSPQFLVSWQAQNYAPSWYEGKILPINGTQVNINFELIDGGKLADLSKTIVRWYVNDKLIINEKSGLGIKNLKINAPDFNGDNTEIRIALVNYKGGELIDKIVEIPVSGPEAVINAPYPDGKIGIGSSVLGLIPFFFNISDISNFSIDWLVNGRTPDSSNNPYLFNLNIGSDTPQNTQINISVSVKNILKTLEFTSQSINLIVK